METNQQSFLFFELVTGDILAEIPLKDDELIPEKELKQEAKLLSKDFGLQEQDIAWVKCYPASSNS
jgi:hypothetical protein